MPLGKIFSRLKQIQVEPSDPGLGFEAGEVASQKVQSRESSISAMFLRLKQKTSGGHSFCFSLSRAV